MTLCAIRFSRRRYFAVHIAACLLFFAACATAPPPFQPEDAAVRLPSGAIITGLANTSEAAPLIRAAYPELFANKNAEDFLRRTKSAVFGFYRNEGKPSVFIITQGAYPVSSYNLGFSFSKDWKSRPVKGAPRSVKEWYNGGAALRFAKTEAVIQLGALPDAAAADTAPSAVIMPDVPLGNAALSAVVSLSEVSRIIRSMNIPLDMPLASVHLYILPNEEDWTVRLALAARSPSEAKALFALLSLARSALGRNVLIPSGDAAPTANVFAALFLSNPPALEGSALILESAALPARSIARLFSSFLLQS